MSISLGTADEIAAQLGITLAETPVCVACLSFVSAGLREGDEKDARRWAKEMASMIWEEGLAEPAREAVRRALERGVSDADACLADLDARGGRSLVARAIVFRLAAELAEHERRSFELHRQAREVQGTAPPEWN